MKLNALLPKHLDKSAESYKSVEELNNVLSVAKEKNIRNIALTGPYGSGKSSILVTLMKDYSVGRNFLPISLATLQAIEQNNSILSNKKTKKKGIIIKMRLTPLT